MILYLITNKYSVLAQAARIDEIKIPWYKKNILFGVIPSNLANKIFK